ncbi:MAG: hypothetical protein ABI867_09275 [Kofleriaceae bacterium]
MNDAWYESEEPTRLGMVAELQRIRRRSSVRPLPVIALALLITSAVTYKVATKKKLYTADVVLAVTEGSLTTQGRDNGIPFDQLKEYVSQVLLPDPELAKLIERLTPGRIDKVGIGFALESFRDKIEVTIWKNSFIYYTHEDANSAKSARIGIEVGTDDPDDAYEIAQQLAAIAIRTHDEQRKKVATALSSEVGVMRETIQGRLETLSATITAKTNALFEARRRQNTALASVLIVDLATLTSDQKRANEQLRQIDASPDAMAERVTDAGLDMQIAIVDSVHPERQEQSGMMLAMVIAVIGVGSLIGSALVLGAFDARVHDVDDVTRLHLPVLGHLPGFPGDHVGSLQARGAARRRVPSFRRWRSQR